MSYSDSFYIEEYKWLRAEISEKAKETRALERYAVLGTGAVWAWLLAATDTTLPLQAWFIPFALACASALRSLALMLDILNTAIYLRNVEAKVKKVSNPIEWEGWETWLHKQLWSLKPTAILYVVTTIIFWLLLLSGTFIGGWWLPSLISR